MKTRNAEHTAFVASLMYGAELWPMSVEEARYTMEQWKEEGSVEVPEGFTPEIYAEIWNAFIPADDDVRSRIHTHRRWQYHVGCLRYGRVNR